MRIPRFMGEGSKGPHVVLLKAFFLGRKVTIEPTNLYDAKMAAAVTELQARARIMEQGVGPRTRQRLVKKHGFDFEMLAMLVPGVTKFVDPAVTTLVGGQKWTPEYATICDDCRVQWPYEHRCLHTSVQVFNETTDSPCDCPMCNE